MRTVGVIAEYNPFHSGHAHHLRQARALARADAAVAVMSTCFTQRGEAALLSPADRAQMALLAGADAVFALPAMWSVRDAEHFALGGVSLLTSLGVDAISFGAETADIDLLARAAALLEEPDEQLSTAMQARMSRGLPYPAALSDAIRERDPAVASLLDSPNNTLAVCYLRAIRRLGAEVEVIPVPRQGAYHDTSLTGAFASATALRGAILRGDWHGAEQAMPVEAFSVLRDAALHGRLHRPEALDLLLLDRLRAMTPEELRQLPDLSEGVELRLSAAAQSAATREELLQSAKTRRYTHARLSRLCAHALLGFTAPLLTGTPLPPAAWLLGLRESARPLMSRLTRANFPILAKAADADRTQPWFRAELRAYDLWALGAGLPAGLLYTSGVVRV